MLLTPWPTVRLQDLALPYGYEPDQESASFGPASKRVRGIAARFGPCRAGHQNTNLSSGGRGRVGLFSLVWDDFNVTADT